MSFQLFEPRDTSASEEPIDKIIMEECSKYVKIPGLYGKYGEVAKKQLVQKIPSDHLCWGISSLDYDEGKLITVPWGARESCGIFIMGIRGSGKSVLFKNIVLDQLHHRFDHYVVAIDPKQVDFSRIHEPIRETPLIENLAKIGLQPHGYKVKRIIPRCLVTEGEPSPFGAQKYMLSIKNFRYLGNPQVQINTLLYMLGIKQATAQGESLQRALTMLNNRDQRPTELRNLKYDTEALYRFIIADVKKQQTERKESQEEEVEIKRRGTSSGLYFKFRDKMAEYVIGNALKPTTVDFVKELVNNGVLVLTTNLDTDNERNTNIYVKVLIHEILADIMKFRQGKQYKQRGARGLIDKPVTFAIDESDVLIPAELKAYSPAKSTIFQLLTKYRYWGVSLVLVSQDPSMVFPRIISQCRYLLTPKVTYDTQAQIIRERGVPEYVIEQLRKLDASKKVKQWACIDINQPNDEPTIFYPLPPLSAIPKEDEITLQRDDVDEL